MTIEEYEQLSEIEGYSQILNDLLTNGKCTVRLHIGSDYHEYRITDSDPNLFDCSRGCLGAS